MNRLLIPGQILDLRKKISRIFLPAVCFVLIGLCSVQRVTGQGNPVNDSLMLRYYNQKAFKLMNQYKYDESLDTLKLALKIKENALTYYYIGHIYSSKQEWEDAIVYGEKAVSMDTSIMPAYFDLFLAYISVGRWDDAKSVSDKANRGDADHILAQTIASVDWLVDNGNRSNRTVIVFLLIFAGAVIFSFYRVSKDAPQNFSDGKVRFTEVLLVSGSISSILYSIFYHFSHWIWSQNQHVPLPDFSYLVRMASLEHDGVESFVLYILVSANIIITLIATAGLLKLRKSKALYLSVCAVLFLLSCYYFLSTGFYPPEPSIDNQYIFVPILLSALSVGLFILYRYNNLLSKLAVVVLCAFAGLITLAPPSTLDFNFVISPALRMYHGFKLSEIYFQYDYFLSFIAYAWMKLNFALDSYPYLFTCSFFLFFIASFFFTDGFFKTKGLSVIFIIALIVARFYLISHNSRVIPQVTPLRLDLWIILLLVAHFKGIHHWLLGTCIGLLVLFHRNLGLIYLSAYVELLVVLFAIDVFSLVQEKQVSVKTVSGLVVKHLRLNVKNLAIIIASIALCFILFHEMFSASATAYRKLGINFLPIRRLSFYWYFPVILGCLLVFLLYMRKRLGERYTNTGLFVLILAVANSMYFYGRSHENNILNLTGILVLTLFVLFDLLIFQAPEEVPPQEIKQIPVKQNKNAPNQNKSKSAISKNSYISARTAYLSLPVIFLFLVSYYYSERIYHKAEAQYNNLIESTFIYPFQAQLDRMDTAAVRQVTNNSPNVYFMDQEIDCYYYYYGKYAPQGYYNPFCAFVYKKDIIDFIQGLLDKGFYIVYNAKELKDYYEYLPSLRYNQQTQKNDIIALKKTDVPLLLPKDANSLLHIGIKDTLASPGLDYEGLVTKENFTIEVVMRPMGPQPPNAGVLNNLSQFAHEPLKGFTFQQSGGMQNQYVVAVSNGVAAVPNVNFNLEDNMWHYIVITADKESFKVYDMGKLIASASMSGQMPLNSELPLAIGNRLSHDCHFRGFIREVNISNGILDQNEMMNRAQKLSGTSNDPVPNSPTK